VDDLCARAGVAANPIHVTTDFESSCLAAIRQVFGDDVTTHGCFYHLTQAAWRKIQVELQNRVALITNTSSDNCSDGQKLSEKLDTGVVLSTVAYDISLPFSAS